MTPKMMACPVAEKSEVDAFKVELKQNLKHSIAQDPDVTQVIQAAFFTADIFDLSSQENHRCHS